MRQRLLRSILISIGLLASPVVPAAPLRYADVELIPDGREQTVDWSGKRLEVKFGNAGLEDSPKPRREPH